jgi:hypothetical protein
MRSLYRRVDRWLMLRHPRLWTTHPHTAVVIALPIYIACTLLAMGVRAVLTPDAANLLAGTYNNAFFGRLPTGIEDQFFDSQIVTWAMQTLADNVRRAYALCSIAAIAASSIGLILWLRKIAARAIEDVFGVSRLLAVGIELAALIGITLVITGPAIWMGLLWTPLPSQRAAQSALDAANWSEIERLSAQRNIVSSRFRDKNQEIVWDRINELSDKQQDWFAPSLRVVRPNAIDLDTKHSPASASTFGAEDFSIRPLTPAGQAYLQTVATATYTLPFERYDSLHIALIDVLRNILWPAGAGFVALGVFLARRAPTRYVVVTFLVGTILLPLLSQFFTSVVTLFIVASTAIASSGAGLSPNDEQLLYVPTIGLSIAYAVQLGILVLLALRGQTATTRRRQHVLATLALPFAIAHGVILLTSQISISQILAATRTLNAPEAPDFEPVMRAAAIVIAMLPFLWIPIMPFIDKSLRRLQAKPTA